jgi:hypothetical protein
MLTEIRDESNPTALRLRAAIVKWESSLSFWQRLNWRWGNIAPANCKVPIDFEPGEFELEVTSRETVTPAGNAPNLRTAV